MSVAPIRRGLYRGIGQSTLHALPWARSVTPARLFSAASRTHGVPALRSPSTSGLLGVHRRGCGEHALAPLAVVSMLQRNWASTSSTTKVAVPTPPTPSTATKTATAGDAAQPASNTSTDTTSTAVSNGPPRDSAVAAPEAKKKPLKERIKDELLHYWHGTKLLAKEVRISSKLLWQMLKGEHLTRRENRQLRRTATDLFRLVPFSVFLIVPFMELLLPVALKLFPGMLPSTFEAKEAKEEKRRKLLKVRIEMAKFFRETIDEGVVTKRGKQQKAPTTELIDFFHELRNTDKPLDTSQLMAIAIRLGDELTLENLSRPQLISMCRYMGINTFGTDTFLRYQLRNRMREIKADDRLIAAEGVDSLTPQELVHACSSRGLRTVGVSHYRMRIMLNQWLDMHLEQQLPSTLLVLTYALALLTPIPSSTPEALRATLSSLPDELVNEAQLSMLEREGLATVKQRLDVIEEQEELIEDERERRKLEEEAAKRSVEQAEASESQQQSESSSTKPDTSANDATKS